jgi:hypothetical protein
MNTNDPRFELIRRCRDEDASNEELSQLEALLRSDRRFREAYVRYTNLDVALSAAPKFREMPANALAASVPHHTGWFSWLPLTAAAAGVVLGLFCAGAAWAVVRPRQVGPKVNAVLLEESFENRGERLTEGFPTGAGVWGGERTALVDGKEAVEPFHGGRMVRLEPSATTPLSYLSRIIDLRGMPRAEAGEVRQIEVTASFHADSPGFRERYTLRVATFGEEPGSIQAQWIDVPWQAVSGRSLSHCKRGLSTQADDGGWQTLTALVEAPPEAASVVISLAAGRLDAAAPRTPHYIDDVRARLVISPRTLKPRKNRK